MEFYTPFHTPLYSVDNNGYTKLAVDPNTAVAAQTFAFALVTYPVVGQGPPGIHGTVERLTSSSFDYSGNAGGSWSLDGLPAQPLQGDGLNLPAQGFYDSVLFYDGTTLFVGGEDYFLSALGAAWTNLTVDPHGNGPYPDFHAIHEIQDPATGALSLYVTTDGGVWQLELSTDDWNDLNGNLQADARVNSVSVSPNDPTSGLAGAQAGGVVEFNDNLGWLQGIGPINPPPGNYFPYGGPVYVDPGNPQIMYGFATSSEQYGLNDTGVEFDFGAGDPISILVESLDGGKTWNSIPALGPLIVFPALPQANAAPPPVNLPTPYDSEPALYVDPVDPARLLVGGAASEYDVPPGTDLGTLLQSLDGGTSLA